MEETYVLTDENVATLIAFVKSPEINNSKVNY